MKTVTGNSSVIGVLIGGVCISIIVFGMKYAASILSPMLLAVVIAISVDTLINWLEREIKVDCGPPQTVQVDGEVWDQPPVSAKVIPGVLTILTSGEKQGEAL